MKIKKINVYKNTTETTRASGGNGGSYSSISSSQGESASLDLSQYALKNEVKFTQGDGFNSVVEKDHSLQANNDYETAVGKYNQSVVDETIFTVGMELMRMKEKTHLQLQQAVMQKWLIE